MRISSTAVLAAVLAPLALAGPLNPPAGPITPTGKTLTEVEPRIAVSAATTPGDDDAKFVISQPGSYYLAGNITGESGKHGIQIAANNVTLDLNGFTLIGVVGSLDGITMQVFLANVVIRNGHVRDWGDRGIEARIDAGRIEGITASDNAAWGIENQVNAFTSVITRCEAFRNGQGVASTGNIRASRSSYIVGCVAFDAFGTGISAGDASIVDSCIATSSTGNGIVGGSGSTIRNSSSSNNVQNGIVVANNSLVLANVSSSNGLAGDGANILITGSDNRIEGNLCTDADRGIDLDGAGNFVTRNTCSGNTVNWDIAAGNVCFVVNATTSPAFSGSAGGNPPGSTDPNANFSF